MSEIVSVYATFASVEEARSVGRSLVEERLAACINLLGTCHSIYRWHGKVEEAEEVAAIFKTTAGQAPLLIARLGQLYSYESPAAVVWPISEASEAYRLWVIENSGR
ncbi:divalent-cation tolerance protein CutA [Sphingosinicella rhizophila]|uniref:Divalent-cation tolerance protein CutA n=1 Tax=Sphingosinicella rhizophila TaxID=3050082 RepID=A0ABU3Q4B9_9SPHN|nr:divalent-cation tolerance protein CutA [Sphingosinicella sp. GR2756]MDT9598244.1 divalent-cation tolerance protein CutA [Sphingosinicella sp. GR2756]